MRIIELKTPEEVAKEYFEEFEEKAVRVVELLLEEYDDDLESRRAYKRCGFLLDVKLHLEQIINEIHTQF